MLRILRFQVLGVIGLALLVGAFIAITKTLLIIIGGTVCILPTLLFTSIFFRRQAELSTENQTSRLLKLLLIAEAIKIVLTALLFAWVFHRYQALQEPLNVLFLFIGFCSAQLAGLTSALTPQKPIA